MAQQRRGLGRGLGALIPESPRAADNDAARGTDPGRRAATETRPAFPGDPVEILGVHYQEIAVSAVAPNPRQPRRAFDEEPPPRSRSLNDCVERQYFVHSLGAGRCLVSCVPLTGYDGWSQVMVFLFRPKRDNPLR